MRQNGELCECVAVYVDDLAFAMKNPEEFISVLEDTYKFKVKGTGPLQFHLGADFHRDEHGNLHMSPQKYIDRMIASYERMFGEKPSMQSHSPIEKGDHPELDQR